MNTGLKGITGGVAQTGAGNVYSFGSAASLRSFNLSTPAGWTMVFWWGSVFLIFLTLWML